VKHRLGVFLCVFLAFSGAVNCAPVDVRPQPKLEAAELAIRGDDGEETAIRVEIARTETQRSRGLMGRRSLNNGEGMLFVFERDQMLSFWMKNTLIPLSIAYIASDGRILEMYDMEPQNLTPVRSTRSARYALEVPHGWFNRMGIMTGDVVGPDLTALR
jgi:uncharacterized membrane protein (UPF0127 family)